MELLCPLILSMAMGVAFRLDGLHIDGVHLLSMQEVNKVLGFSIGDTIGEEKIEDSLERLLEAYRDRGYLKAKLDWWQKGTILYVEVDEGSRFTLGAIELEGNRFFSGNYLLSNFHLKEGMVFSQSLFEQDIDRLLTEYENNGFPFCSVKPSDFKLDETLNRISFVLQIDEGLLTRVGGFEFKGNHRTKDWVIQRELKIAEGEIYSKKRVDDALKRLNRLGVIHVEGYDLKLVRNGWVNINLRIEEVSSNSMEGVVGWTPKGTVSGSLHLRAGNLFGTLRSFYFQWLRKDPMSSYLHLVYKEPWLFGAPLTGELDVEATVEDTSYTVHSSSVKLLSKIFEPFIIGVGVGVDRITALKATMPNSEKLSVILHSGVDTRDSHSNPTKGIFYSLSTKYSIKFNHPSQHFTEETQKKTYVTKTQFKFLNYIPSKKDVLYIEIGGGKLSSKERFQSPWDQFKLGGLSTVRGYKEEQFLAPQVFWVNLEYRFMLGGFSWVSPFFDLGYYSKNSTEWIYGWGLGMGLTSRLGLVKIYYGIGREDSLWAGKVHFGLSTVF